MICGFPILAGLTIAPAAELAERLGENFEEIMICLFEQTPDCYPEKSKSEMRQQRWATCARYIRLGDSIDEGRRIAKRDGVSFNTSVWITALGKMLGGEV